MIDNPDFLLTAFARLPAVETALRFITENSATDHRTQKFRRLKDLAFLIINQRFVKVLHHVTKDIESYQIKRTEGSTLRTAHDLSRDLVYLFNRIAIFEHRLDRDHGAKGADAISDKVWPVLRGHNSLA